MSKRLRLLAACILAWGLLVQCAATVGSRLEGQVVDEATGELLAARVAITDVHGKFVEIEGNHEHVQQLGKRWCYVDGSFAAPVPESGVTIEIRRGLETRPLIQSVSGQTSESTTRTFRLRRWTDMRAKGFVSGDIHAHMPAVPDAFPQMKAEDLNVLNLMLLGGLPLPNDAAFTGKVDDDSRPGCEIYVGQEIVEWQLGHLTLLGLKSLVPGYEAPGGTLEYWVSNPHLDILPAMRAAREQNGLISWAHFENLPGAAFPVAAALGFLDAIELPTWSDPMQLPAHLTPWENSGMAAADLSPMRGVDLYYQCLNAGFRLPLAAGTDKFGEEIAVGGNRAYVAAKPEADYAGWLAGIRAGTGFVTNGPILDFEAEGHTPGEVIEFQGAKTIKARVRARSILPFTTLDILLNGRSVGHKLILVENNPAVDGVYTMETEVTIDLEQSSWLAARAVSNPDITPRLLARESSVFAHTSPIYFLKDGRKVREEASIQYLRKYVRGLLNWLATRPVFARGTEPAALRRDAEQALKFYEELGLQALQ